jgi:hypothetical protein
MLNAGRGSAAAPKPELRYLSALDIVFNLPFFDRAIRPDPSWKIFMHIANG